MLTGFMKQIRAFVKQIQPDGVSRYVAGTYHAQGPVKQIAPPCNESAWPTNAPR